MYTRISRDDVFFLKILGASFVIHGFIWLLVSL